MSDVDLAIKVTADAKDASNALESVGDAAAAMATDVDNASAKADVAASKLGDVAASADNVDSKMSAATGSLGALAGGLEAAGFPGAAAGLQGVATAADAAGGAGGLLNLVLESQAVMTARAKVAAIGKAAADKVMAATSKAAAVGQWALNAALSANPIGLVVLAVAALVGGLVLAYNKSETFRNIVDKAMGGAKTAVGFVVDRVKDVVSVIKDVTDKVPGMGTAFDAVKSVITTAMNVAKAPIDLVVGALDKVMDAIKWLQDHGGKLLDKGLNAVGLRAVSGLTGLDTTPAVATSTQPTVAITVQGALDPYAVAVQIVQLLSRYGISVSGVVTA